jgi:glycosyltransferase involved in cell wall biosynthesis
VNDYFIKNNIELLPFDKKQNKILISGRIGAPEKNHEILLNVLPKLNLKDWKVFFVGPVDKAFQSKINNYYDQFPQLKNKVVFKGEISNRIELYQQYNQSKVMCLTSEKESFGIAMAEALYFGNYLIGTDGMFAFDELSNNEKFGVKLPFNKSDELQHILQQIIDGKIELHKLSQQSTNYAENNFTWSKIVQKLVNALNE